MNKLQKDNIFLNDFELFKKSLNGQKATPFFRVREEAIENFAKLGFPTRRMEAWKYTDVSPISKHDFRLAGEQPAIQWKKIEPFLLPDTAGTELVFVNGRVILEFSTFGNQPGDVIIESLPNAFKNAPHLIERYLAKYADYREDVFTALNTAFASSGTFIFIPDGHVLEKPIHLLHLSVPGKALHHSQLRTLIILGKGSQLSLIETFSHLGEKAYFNNCVTEIVTQADSNLEHIRIQNESQNSYRISSTEVHQERNSVYTSINIDLGGSLVRNNLNIRLDALNCEAHLYGFYLTSDKQHVDNHTLIDHAKPLCNSNELYKGVLSGKSHAVFSGTIFVRPDAQKTNAFQSNKNLLLSDDAEVDSKPQLKIYADDVKCTHGATIGQLDDTALFYLQQRGISKAQARIMLRDAFAGEVIDKIKNNSVREKTAAMISKRFKDSA